MPRKPAEFEESKHYNGEAIARFYPGAHYYKVDDDGYINPLTGKPQPLKGQRMGGGTSLTGVMAKGQGLMLYPMYEMRKYLKQFFRTNTIEDFFDSNMTIEDLLKEACNAHVKKSDRGKNVGTDAHAWVEQYLRELMRVQDGDVFDFKCPEIPSVEDIAIVLRKSYLAIFNAHKPTNVEEYMQLPKLLFQDAEIQQALWTEATMLHRSTTAAKAWFELHDIYVHGTEDTVYSRKLQVCGKYDADISVTCSEKCGWCYLNGDEEKKLNILNESGDNYKFKGRYIADFKSTNASRDAPKGVYPEYLAQCGVYDLAKTEEFPEIKYDGHLILNGSKNEGTFATHFSFERERNCAWAMTLADVKEFMYDAGKEVKESA
jgi:hypothetical protein